jgi:hypothetical protein
MTDNISLREYVDIRFDAQEKAVQTALATADRASTKAENASDKRFEGVNEFRSALADNARLLMPRQESEQSFRVLAEKIDVLAKRVDARDDRNRGGNQLWVILVAAIATICSILSVILIAKR